MAKAETAQAPPQNSDETAAPPPPPRGRPFAKGQSGNPGGRPKGLSRRTREVIGEDGDTLVRLWAATTSGWLVSEHPETHERSYTQVSVADRIAASKLLAAYGWGKPPEFQPIEADDPLELALGPEQTVAEALEARVVQIEEARRRRESADLARREADVG